MGNNGRQAIKTLYNWELEGQKLLFFYNAILGPTPTPSVNLLTNILLKIGI